jgi:hypothetical protein
MYRISLLKRRHGNQEEQHSSNNVFLASTSWCAAIRTKIYVVVCLGWDMGDTSGLDEFFCFCHGKLLSNLFTPYFLSTFLLNLSSKVLLSSVGSNQFSYNFPCKDWINFTQAFITEHIDSLLFIYTFYFLEPSPP